LLGHTTIDGRPFYVRQMKNMKASMPVQFMTGEPFEFWALHAARCWPAHMPARVMPPGLRGTAARTTGSTVPWMQFAESCGDQTERDHAELVRAIKNGRAGDRGRRRMTCGLPWANTQLIRGVVSGLGT
jgi:hypothetical protein